MRKIRNKTARSKAGRDDVRASFSVRAGQIKFTALGSFKGWSKLGAAVGALLYVLDRFFKVWQ